LNALKAVWSEATKKRRGRTRAEPVVTGASSLLPRSFPPSGLERSDKSERKPHSNLRSERNSHRGSRAKKISQGSAGRAQLVDVGDGPYRAAIGIGAEIGHIARSHFGRRYRQRSNVSNLIVPRVLPIEQIEELNKRVKRHAVTEIEISGHAQINLGKR
jgi:hypothetical protein